VTVSSLEAVVTCDDKVCDKGNPLRPWEGSVGVGQVIKTCLQQHFKAVQGSQVAIAIVGLIEVREIKRAGEGDRVSRGNTLKCGGELCANNGHRLNVERGREDVEVGGGGHGRRWGEGFRQNQKMNSRQCIRWQEE
jgi:hypothetical protein